MSDTLFGVIIGGVLSLLGTWMTMYIQHKRWVIELRIERLNIKRGRLEAAYEIRIPQLLESMENNTHNVDSASDFDIIFPDVVSKAFDDFIEDTNKSIKNKREHYLHIRYAMKKSLKAIDDEIDEIIVGKRLTTCIKVFLFRTTKKCIARWRSQEKKNK